MPAVPLTVFTLDYCIRYPACSMREIAERELETVMASGEYDARRDFEPSFQTARIDNGSRYDVVAP